MPAAFAAAPALLIGRGTSISKAGELAPPALPVAFLSHPNGQYRFETSAAPGTSTYISPRAQYVAVEQLPTGIATGNFQIKSLATGKVLETAEYQGNQAPSQAIWSSDDRVLMYQDEKTIYVHRMGGATIDLKLSAGLASSVGYSSGSGGSAVVGCASGGFFTAALAGRGTTHGVSDYGARCDVMQTVANNGDAVAIYLWKDDIYRLTQTGLAQKIATSSLDGKVARLLSTCNGLVNFSFGTQGSALYDVESGAVTVTTHHFADCAIPSPDRKNYAVQQADGIFVVASRTGTGTKVARTGSPIAWSKDGKAVLAYGNGTFLLKADGSGGTQASTQIDGTSSNAYLYCRAADTGKAVITTTDGPVLYDVGSDKATTLPKSILAAACGVTGDGAWLVSGALLVNLQDGTATTLPSYDEAQQTAVTAPSPGLADYRWSGPQRTTASAGRYGTST